MCCVNLCLIFEVVKGKNIWIKQIFFNICFWWKLFTVLATKAAILFSITVCLIVEPHFRFFCRTSFLYPASRNILHGTCFIIISAVIKHYIHPKFKPNSISTQSTLYLYCHILWDIKKKFKKKKNWVSLDKIFYESIFCKNCIWRPIIR